MKKIERTACLRRCATVEPERVGREHPVEESPGGIGSRPRAMMSWVVAIVILVAAGCSQTGASLLDPENLPHPCDLLGPDDVAAQFADWTQSFDESRMDRNECSWMTGPTLDAWGIDVELGGGVPGITWPQVMASVEDSYGLCDGLDGVPGFSHGLSCGDDPFYVVYWQDNEVRGRHVGTALLVKIGAPALMRMPGSQETRGRAAAEALAVLVAQRAVDAGTQ